VSFRQQKNHAIAAELGFMPDAVVANLDGNNHSEYIYQSRLMAEDPYLLLECAAGTNKELYQNALRAIGSGKSPWIQLALCRLKNAAGISLLFSCYCSG
jgi:hypothetical protein